MVLGEVAVEEASHVVSCKSPPLTNQLYIHTYIHIYIYIYTNDPLHMQLSA